MTFIIIWAPWKFFLLSLLFLCTDYPLFRLITAQSLCPTSIPTPAPLLQAPAHRVDNKMMTNSQKWHQGGTRRPVKQGTCKVHTQYLNTHYVTLTTHPQGTTATADGAKAPAPCPWAAAHGLWVHTVNTIHTHPMLMSNCSLGGWQVLWPWGPWTTGYPPTNMVLPTPTPEQGKTRQQASMSTDTASIWHCQQFSNCPQPCRPQYEPAPPTTASNCSQGGYRVQVQLGDGGMGMEDSTTLPWCDRDSMGWKWC